MGMEINELTNKIIGAAIRVHKTLLPGYLESVYHNAMIIEMQKEGLEYVSEKEIDVFYDGICIGKFKADLVIEGRVIVELKAVSSITTAHEAQLVNYLTATGIDDGLILNFGAPKLEIKRKYRIYTPSKYNSKN